MGVFPKSQFPCEGQSTGVEYQTMRFTILHLIIYFFF